MPMMSPPIRSAMTPHRPAAPDPAPDPRLNRRARRRERCVPARPHGSAARTRTTARSIVPGRRSPVPRTREPARRRALRRSSSRQRRRASSWLSRLSICGVGRRRPARTTTIAAAQEPRAIIAALPPSPLRAPAGAHRAGRMRGARRTRMATAAASITSPHPRPRTARCRRSSGPTASAPATKIDVNVTAMRPATMLWRAKSTRRRVSTQIANADPGRADRRHHRRSAMLARARQRRLGQPERAGDDAHGQRRSSSVT